jgi:hypothetical protein
VCAGTARCTCCTLIRAAASESQSLPHDGHLVRAAAFVGRPAGHGGARGLALWGIAPQERL